MGCKLHGPLLVHAGLGQRGGERTAERVEVSTPTPRHVVMDRVSGDAHPKKLAPKASRVGSPALDTVLAGTLAFVTETPGHLPDIREARATRAASAASAAAQ
jgi:hypothetical protein